MRHFIDRLIEKKKSRYIADYNEMLGDYYREQEIVSGYNGRQLLELLQNCDDEGSNVVVISLNTENNTISISNNGTAFSEKGYRSLFIANLSSKKSKRKYIGNKGLGFRSIINWSNSIEILSNNLSLMYSEEIISLHFNEMFSREIQNKIRFDEKLSKHVIPMPFLSLPKISENVQGEFVTTINIHYKDDYFDNIIEQIEKITPETLLFLKHINEVRFVGFENLEDIKCEKEAVIDIEEEFSPKQKIKFKDNTWYIFEEENDLPVDFSDIDNNEQEFYQIKIAVEENFNKSSPFLFSFFPTNIQLKQPYILHATFDLDATRNQLNNSIKNKFLLKKVVEFTITVSKYFAKTKVSYQPLLILNHKHHADTLENLNYYELIKTAIESEELFPCIDNTYKKRDDVIYISDEFANMLSDLKATEIIGSHIIPLNDLELADIDFEEQINTNLNSISNIIDLLNQISELKLNTKERARFISQLLQECNFIRSQYQHQLNILTNGKNVIISGDEYIYTPSTQSSALKTPSYTNIQFVNRNLFNELLLILDYEKSNSKNKSRFIYEKLKGFCNIHSYEPTTVAQKIISETNSLIEQDTKPTKELIKELHSCLYYNFRQVEIESGSTSLKVKVPILTLDGETRNTEDLILSKYYPTGEKAALIFEAILSYNHFVASPLEIGLPIDIDNYDAEEYLLWLGVNKFAKYETITTSYTHKNYFEHVKKIKNINDSTGYDITLKSINGFETILNRISPNNLILWIYFDSDFKKQMNDLNNADVVKNYFRVFSNILNKPSYLKYLIQEKYKFKFENLLIDDQYLWVNDTNIDYNDVLFTNNDVSKSSINEILVLLGAKDDFIKISINKVAKIINKIPDQFPDGKRSQYFYKKALAHYKENKIPLNSSVKLFADNGKGLSLYNQREIYFSDRIKLPKHLKQSYPIFNFPVRAGGAEAIKFYGIKDLKIIDIAIQSYTLLDDLTSEFKNYLDKIKPLILTVRINSIDDEKIKKTQASICNKIEIKICSEISYQVDDVNYQIADYEFLHAEDNTYFLKANIFDTIFKLRKNINFVDSFSDILSLSFDISGEKSEFKNILRGELNEVLVNIKNDFGEDTFHEARNILGLADYKHAFFEAIFKSKDISYFEQLDDLSLEELIKNKFNIDFDPMSIDYEHVNEESELDKIKILFDELNLDLELFASNYPYSISMDKIHFRRIKNYVLNKKITIKKSVWHQLKDQSIEIKALFLDKINMFEDYEDFALRKAKEFRWSFFMDIERVVSEYIQIVYGNIDIIDFVDIEKIRDANLGLFKKEQISLINESERLKSLLYFPDTFRIIQSELAKFYESELADLIDIEIPLQNTNIINSENLIPKVVNSSISGKKRSVYLPKLKDSRLLKEKGNASEQIVFNYLKENKFINVDLVSQDNEGLHYDIRYTNEHGVVKYVEVKSFDSNYFHLSKSEYDFGKSNAEDYEIWLVQNKQNLIPIRDFFTNPKYELIVNEYLVYLELKNIE